MKVVVVLTAVLVVAALSALAGLTAGINLNPQSTVKFVPDWGSLADWVAGIGSMAAVAATVYFGWKQRQDLLPRLSMHATGAIVALGNVPINIFVLRLSNPGAVPVELKGVFISSDRSNESLWLPPTMVIPGTETLPAVLSPGKGMTIHFDRHALGALKKYVAAQCGGEAQGLRITATGSIRDFSIPLDPLIPKIA
ncbi:hypothetical protein [Pseudomonas sp. C5pp]|uniref:hypothetical protein n=1 Tax=Pseudomonas sp. C5pp TaxID=1586081 RepID=UPI00057EDB3A|nr:hypothetical protein [Pseudomonas sp. C5pp]KIC79332.1 hypothetical protein RR51_27190 [Pseudomonas sp. C5pp]